MERKHQHRESTGGNPCEPLLEESESAWNFPACAIESLELEEAGVAVGITWERSYCHFVWLFPIYVLVDQYVHHGSLSYKSEATNTIGQDTWMVSGRNISED